MLRRTALLLFPILLAVTLTAAPATAAGDPPQHVRVAVVGPTSLQWTWDAYPNAARYRVAISRHRDMSASSIRWVSGHWVTAQLLPRSTTFYLSVRAESAAGLSDASAVVAARTSAVPTGLRILERTPTKLTWTWHGYKDAPRYEVQLSSDASFASRRSRVVTGTSGVLFHSLEPDRRYYARVRAVRQDWSPLTGWSAVRSTVTGPADPM